MKIRLFIIKSIIIMRINLMIKFKIIKNKRLIKQSLLNKISTMIMRKINLMIKFISLSIFISPTAIALYPLIRNRNFINI